MMDKEDEKHKVRKPSIYDENIVEIPTTKTVLLSMHICLRN